jgi:hypothetical protein
VARPKLSKVQLKQAQAKQQMKRLRFQQSSQCSISVSDFTEEDRLFFEQIKEKVSKDQQVIQTALANPKDKFKIGIRKLIEGRMIQRLGENDKIVTRYVEDQDFQNAAFDGLAGVKSSVTEQSEAA